MSTVSQGGFYFFHLLDRYAAGYSILIAVLFEAIAVSWIYGTRRFCDDIKDMIGFAPGYYWRVCWNILAPAFLMVSCVSAAPAVNCKRKYCLTTKRRELRGMWEGLRERTSLYVGIG